MVVIFYKVTMNNELVTAEPMPHRGNTGLASWELLVIVFSSIDQHITLFYMCFCLKTLYLIHIIDPLTYNSWPTTLGLILNAAYQTHVVSHKVHHSFLHLGTLGSTSVLYLGAILNNKITKKNTKKQKFGTK